MLKPLQAIKGLFSRGKPPATPNGPAEPGINLATPELDPEPEWKQKLRRMQELCEERKREMRLTQGGRVVEVPEADSIVVQQKEPF